MDGFPSFKGAKLDSVTIKKLQNQFKNWSMFTVGKTNTHVTPSGGIHFSGKPTQTTAVSFEIKRGGGYVIVSLFEYPKGVVFHAHIYYSDIYRRGKDEWEKTLMIIYKEVKTILIGDE